MKKLILLLLSIIVFDLAVAQEIANRHHISLKTNLLYDVAFVPNVGIEYYIGSGWSVGGNCVFAWWKNENKNRFWRIYGLELECRKYLGEGANEKPLSSHHVGAYTQFATYDFELGGRGYIGGNPGNNIFEKANYGIGFEYGYSLPIASRLNMDFSVGVGYFGGKRWEYKPQDGHYVWQSVSTKHWVGPTKAEISLVWLVGKKNFNKDKGGK